jgi:hypothetical protein
MLFCVVSSMCYSICTLQNCCFNMPCFPFCRLNWFSHPPPPRMRVLLPLLDPRGEKHSYLEEGVGGPNSDEGAETLWYSMDTIIVPLTLLSFAQLANRKV